MRRFVAMVAAGVLAAGTVGSLAQRAGASPRATLASSVPSWATHGARHGDAPASRAVSLRVYLQMRNASEADAQVAALNDPTSASFRHYLTAAQFRARYAPTAAAVARVSAWLRSAGLHVGYVPSNHFYVAAAGNVAAAERAFGVRLGEYRFGTKLLRAPDATPTLPSDLAGTVLAVVGLDESAQLVHSNAIVDRTSPNAGAPFGFRNAPPCSAYWNEQQATGLPQLAGHPNPLPWAPCGYTPTDFRSAYGIAGTVARGIDGSGVRVGIVDAFAARTIQQDVEQYAANHDPTHPWQTRQYRQIIPPGIYKVPESNPCDPQGWYGEQTLDVEAVHAMAPGATVIYSGGESCEDPAMDVALNNLIDNNLVDIVSNSYGDLGEDISPQEKHAFDQIAHQAALQGITLVFSSGDDGDETDNLPQPESDFSADSPLVTAVGGTATGINQNGKVVLERGWMTEVYTLNSAGDGWDDGGFLYGSGGGTSRLYSEPTYQTGVVPDSLATRWGGRGRVVPDLSMDGDVQTGMLIGETQNFYEGKAYGEFRIGGTSLSAPLFSGLLAIGVEHANTRMGLINHVIYRMPASDFRDVQPASPFGVVRRNFVNGQNADDGFTSPTIRGIDDESTQSIHVAVGYDDVTGRGVPNGMAFVNALG